MTSPGTVGSIPLIASSVMSKKLAGGAPAIVLDVKQGRGAFMRDLDEARTLAELMVDIGRSAGRRVTAFVTDMDRPLGRCIGNALEVREAIEVLRGDPSDARLVELATTVAGEMLRLGGVASSRRGGPRRWPLTASARASGWRSCARSCTAQGGDPSPIDDPSLLPTAPVVLDVTAASDGYVADVEPLAVASAANRLGAGRVRKGDPIDHAVGVEIVRQVGEAVQRGQVLARVHASTESAAAEAVETVRSAILLGERAVETRSIVLDRVSSQE